MALWWGAGQQAGWRGTGALKADVLTHRWGGEHGGSEGDH